MDKAGSIQIWTFSFELLQFMRHFAQIFIVGHNLDHLFEAKVTCCENIQGVFLLAYLIFTAQNFWECATDS